MSNSITIEFQDIAQNISVRVNPKDTEYNIYVGLEHLDTDSFRIRRKGTPTDVEGDKLLVRKGDIIFGKRRVYQRKVGIADFDGICSAHAMVLRSKKDTIIKELFPFFIQSNQFMNKALQISVGSLSPTINWKTLAKQKFTIPVKEEQKEIASLLCAAEDCIIKNEQFIDEAEKAKKVLTRQLFVKDTQNIEFENPTMKMIPRELTIVTLGNKDYFELKTGGTPSTKKPEYWNGTIPWLLSGEVNNKRITSTEKKITQLGYENSNATWIPRKSVLLALAGQGKTRGTAAITEIELTVNQSIAAIIPKTDKILPDFLFYKLDSMYEFLRNYSGGSNRGGLSLRSIRDISIDIPSIHEQQQITSILTQCDNTILNARINLAAMVALKMKLIDRFFSGDDN